MSLQSLKYMVDSLTPAAYADSLADEADRRRSLRIDLPFPAVVRGVDANNQAFEEHAVLDNFSATSVSLPLTRRLEAGTRIFLVVRLSTEPVDEAPAPLVAIRGVVYRVEQQHDSKYSLAVIFRRYRFLYQHTDC